MMLKFNQEMIILFSRYVIEVTAKYGDKLLTSQLSILTDPEPPKLNPKAAGPTYLSAWWPAVPGSDSYTVQLFREGDLIDSKTFEPENVLTWKRSDLNPETLYELRVSANQGEKSFSSVAALATLPIPPAPVLNVEQIFTTSVKLSWEKDPAWLGLATPTVVVPQKLVLTYSDLTGVIGEKEMGITSEYILVQDIEGNKAYSFELRAVYSFGRSVLWSKNLKTFYSQWKPHILLEKITFLSIL